MEVRNDVQKSSTGENQDPKDRKDRDIALIRALSSEIKLEGEDPTSKQKMSFSISKLSHLLIKNASEKFGVTQGNIVDLAPFLFEALARQSLERREKAIPTLELLTKQISGSVTAMINLAPHLERYFREALSLISDAVYAEKAAVERKHYAGIEDSSALMDLLDSTSSDDETAPYYQEIKGFLEKYDDLKTIAGILLPIE